MTKGLPVSRLIDVQIVLTPVAAQIPNLNTAIIIGDSDVIDTAQRYRSYGSIEEVASDFGTTAPEYLAAELFFGQTPQPDQLYIGRWASAATPGELRGGGVSAAKLLISAWTGITTGAFLVFEDGIPYNITGLNFSAETNLNGVAENIEDALEIKEASSTVVWNAGQGRFEIYSGTTGVNSSVGYLQTSAAIGNAVFAGQPTAENTLTIEGTAVEFVSGAPGALEVQIGADLPGTLANLLAFLNSSVDANIALMTYYVVGSTLYMIAKATGTAGNTYTLTTNDGEITPTAPTGGSAGTDLSADYLSGTLAKGALSINGIATETPLAAYVILDALNFYFYASCFAATAAISDAQYESVAGFVEAASNKHVLGITSSEAGIITEDDTSNIAYALQQLNYNRSFVQYSSTNPYAVASFIGRFVTVDFNGSLTTLTMMYKQEPGVPPESLSSTQADAAEACNANVITGYVNSTAIIQYGTMASGSFFDDVYDTDWLGLQIQTNVFNLLYTTPTKIPQTNAGNHLIANQIESACVQGVVNGTLAPGQWNGPSFGQLKTGDYLPKGYYIYTPDISSQSQGDREARKGVTQQVAAKLAGAVHTVDIIVNVNR